jgi:aminoglycoside 3-N-acetyltransferase
MKKHFDKILKETDSHRLMRNTARLLEAELGQTFDDYRKAAAVTADIIKESGIENYEIVNFPADGKTVYMDARMPMAWRASKGRLTIKSLDNPVAADFQAHPFHLVKGSVSTPKDGLTVRIITEAQLFGGENAGGCLVMAEPNSPPRPKLLTTALDLGALGLITDFLTGRYDTPDAVQWVNACTEGSHWHVQADDRPFICFSVSPRTGDKIREAARTGYLSGFVECDGERYEGELPAVTALIPGKRKEELWIISHLYEPLSDDNSSGVVGSIEAARVIKKLAAEGKIPPLEFSLRLVFAMEFYGYAAFAEKFCPASGHNVIGALNTDSMAGDKHKIWLAPPGTPFFGNFLMEKLCDEYKWEKDPSVLGVVPEGFYADDTFLSDPTIGIPSMWLVKTEKTWWHNSAQDMSIISPKILARITAFTGAWAASVLTTGGDSLSAAVCEAGAYARKHLADEAARITRAFTEGGAKPLADLNFEISERMLHRLRREERNIADFRDAGSSEFIQSVVSGLQEDAGRIIPKLQAGVAGSLSAAPEPRNDKWLDYTESIVPARASRGFPFDLAAVPKKDRRRLPDGMIYGPFARVLANMDGVKTLQRLIREAEWEADVTLGFQEIKKYVTAVSYLTDCGYLKTEFKKSVTQKDIVETLRKAGIKEGDLLFVHSGLSHFGRVEGGSDAFIDAVLAAAGPSGTVLFPTFTRPFTAFGDVLLRGESYRPHDPSNPDLVWVGDVPKAFLRRKNVIRSAHATHSAAGLGPLAEACLSAHKEADPPSGSSSPLAKLLEHKGKMLFFGAGIESMTFLHYLEDVMNLPYLESAVCGVKDGRRTRFIVIPKHLPGHRDFYTSKASGCKFFKRAAAAGLQINEHALGMGKVRVTSAVDVYKIGVKLVKEDPDIFLCDSPDCAFCAKYRRK